MCMLYDFILGDNIVLGMIMPILQVLIGEICEDRAKITLQGRTHLIVGLLAIHVMIISRDIRVPRIIWPVFVIGRPSLVVGGMGRLRK
jgi:hypothetical protein